MMNPNDEVLSVLRIFRHGHRTDLTKGTINNRDACAFILFKLGPTSFADLKAILNAWRGPSTNEWNKGRPLAQTYLFNSCRSGGYGCVADHPMQRGWTMSNEGWSGIVPDKRSETEKTFFRRTYWYRIAKGTYAPTVECVKRMAELGLN